MHSCLPSVFRTEDAQALSSPLRYSRSAFDPITLIKVDKAGLIQLRHLDCFYNPPIVWSLVKIRVERLKRVKFFESFDRLWIAYFSSRENTRSAPYIPSLPLLPPNFLAHCYIRKVRGRERTISENCLSSATSL